MIEFGLNDKLMDIDASFKENRIDFAMAGLAFTLLDEMFLFVVAALFQLGWEALKAGLSLAKEYLETKLKHRD